MTADLRSKARAGDGDAFRQLTEPHRRELLVHCYRMLASFQDAEDAVQDTMLAAWQGLAGFEGRASLRTWLYRIATDRRLNARRLASRRPAKEWDIPGVEPPAPTRLGEVVWLEPFPDAVLEGAIDAPLSDPAIVGRSITLSGEPHVVIGVMPPGFDFPPAKNELWRILTMNEPRRRGPFYTWGIARLKKGATLDTMRANLDAVSAAIKRQYPPPGAGKLYAIPQSDEGLN